MANPMRKRRSVTWLWILFGPVFWIVLALATTVRPSSREPVREELIRLQQQTGLSLASFGFGLYLVWFARLTLFKFPIPPALALCGGPIRREAPESRSTRFTTTI